MKHRMAPKIEPDIVISVQQHKRRHMLVITTICNQPNIKSKITKIIYRMGYYSTAHLSKGRAKFI